MSKTVLYLVTEDYYFVSHRLNLAREAKRRGCHVVVVCNLNNFKNLLEEFDVKSVAFERGSMNPFKEIKVFFQIGKIYKGLKPDVVHQVAFKPALYGSFWAKIFGVPKVINAFVGVGFSFTEKSFKAFIAKFIITFLSRLILRSTSLIVQNKDDVALWSTYLPSTLIHLIPGVGVDLEKFYPLPEHKTPVKIIMVSRLLWTKGIKELIETSKILKGKNISFILQLVGEPDPQNPASVFLNTLQQWQQEGLIEWLGQQNNIADLYQKAHIAVLPSYREGMPKSLLEASACGKPIVTTDVPGCRDVVINGENGFLVPPKNSRLLSETLEKLILSKELREKMGQKSRERAEMYFSEDKVISKTLDLY